MRRANRPAILVLLAVAACQPAPTATDGRPVRGGTVPAHLAARLARLEGVAVAPAAVLANHGAGLVGNHGGGLIGDQGAARRLLALDDVPVAGALATLASLDGKPLADAATVATDAQGRFAFAARPVELPVLVSIGKGDTHLEAIARPGEPVTVSPASTLAAAHFRRVLGGEALDRIPAADVARLTEALENVLAKQAVRVDFASEATAADAFDRVAAASGAVAAAASSAATDAVHAPPPDAPSAGPSAAASGAPSGAPLASPATSPAVGPSVAPSATLAASSGPSPSPTPPPASPSPTPTPSVAPLGLLSAFEPESATLVDVRQGHRAVAVGDWVYVIGGFGNSRVPDGTVERAKVGADGHLGAFSLVPGVSLHEPREAFAASVVGGYVYVLGGEVGGSLGDHGYTAGVERAPVDAAGNFGPFEQVGAGLAETRAWFESVVVGNWLYVVGGGNYYHVIHSVERAAINPDGSLGGFAAVGGLSTAVHYSFPAFASGSRLYLVAGFNGSAAGTTVEGAPIQANGDLGAFAVPTGVTAATPLWGAVGIATESRYYVFGGNTDGKGVEEAVSNADGTIGNFSASSFATAVSRTSAGCVRVGNRVFLIGGGPSDQAVPSVESAGVH